MAYRYGAIGDCHWGLRDPRNGLRFRPTAQNREVFRQASENTVRFSGRLDRPLLRMVSTGLSLRKAALPSDWDAQSIAQMPKWEHLHAKRRLDLSLDLSAVLSADLSADLSEALSLDLPLDLPAGLSLDPARFQLLPLWPWRGHTLGGGGGGGGAKNRELRADELWRLLRTLARCLPLIASMGQVAGRGKSQDGTSSRIRQVVGLSPLPPYDILLI